MVKNITMNFKATLRVLLLPVLCALAFTACEIDEQIDPNGPSLNSVLTDASITELNLLVTGIEAQIRNGFGTYVTASGTVARELYLFDADPRNTSDLLGKDDLVIDANTFYLTAPFSTRYRVVKNANTLLEALDNTDQVTAAQADGYRGFANTMKGLMLSQVLDLLGDNGVRVDVADPSNLGPFLGPQEGYTAILDIMDMANQQLNGAEFAFTLSAGFAGFDTPSTFAEVNRALTARIALRGERYDVAESALEGSFLDVDGDLTAGPEHLFGAANGDILNPLYKVPGANGDQIIVHPRIIDNIEDGDQRINKFALRPNPTPLDGLNSDYETALFASAISPIDIIRNEELILIKAEVEARSDDADDAVEAINAVRNAAGLDDYDGDTDSDALLSEILMQRTYSLWGEGHAMFDLRRYGLLNADFLPLDRAGDDVFTQFPIPLSEGE